MKHPIVQFNTIMVVIIMTIGFLLSVFPASLASIPAGAAGTENQSATRADYEFSIQFIDDSVTLFPNERDIVDAKIENKGTLEDTYVLEINQVPKDWTITFENTELSIEYPVSPLNSLVFSLFVDTPASGSAFITLKAKSKATGENQTAYMSMTVKQPVIKMELDTMEINSIHGETAVFEVNITNLQEKSDNVTITLTGSDITPGEQAKLNQWTYSITPSRLLVLNANSSIIIKVNIYTPTDPGFKQTGVFTIQAKPDADKDNPIEDVITVEVEELILVEGSVNPAKAAGTPGQELSFTVTLFNNGTNDLDDVSLFKGDLPAGWEVIYNATVKYPLDRDEKKDVVLKVKVPAFARVGMVKLPMIIQANFGNIVGNFTMMVEVKQVFSVKLSNTDRVTDPVTGGPRYIIDWKLESDAYFKLKNTGNGRDTIKLNFSSVPENWLVFFKSIEPTNGDNFNNVTQVDFSNPLDLTTLTDDNKKLFADPGKKSKVMNLILDPEEEVKITVGINTSFNGKVLYNFTVSAYPGDLKKSASVLMEITLLRSDIGVMDIELSSLVPRVDDNVFITVTLKNQYHVPAENISVILKVSELEIDSKQIEFIKVGDTAFLDFEWSPAKKGNYVLEVEVEGALIAPGTEPILRRNVTVEAKPPEPDGTDDDLTPILIVIVVIIVFTVLVVVLFLTQREKISMMMDKRKEEFQKKNSGQNGKNGIVKNGKQPPAELTGGPGKGRMGPGPERKRLPPPRPGKRK